MYLWSFEDRKSEANGFSLPEKLKNLKKNLGPPFEAVPRIVGATGLYTRFGVAENLNGSLLKVNKIVPLGSDVISPESREQTRQVSTETP